jgi:hypothetical protein
VSFEMSFFNTLGAEGMNQIPDFNSLDHQISYCGSGCVHGALAFCAGFSFVISLSTALCAFHKRCSDV